MSVELYLEFLGYVFRSFVIKDTYLYIIKERRVSYTI